MNNKINPNIIPIKYFRKLRNDGLIKNKHETHKLLLITMDQSLQSLFNLSGLSISTNTKYFYIYI